MSLLPKKFIDAHHHFVDTKNNKFQSFLSKLIPDVIYIPEDYDRDVVDPLAKAGIELVASVHVECMPDSGEEECAWVSSLPSTVKAIVASCDLAQPTADEELEKLKQSSSMVRGVRWILDCVGKFEPNTATHVATSRHDGIDYLRGSNGGYDGQVLPEFERGYALLEKYGLSFDLQCAPVQLLQAAEMIAKYPNVKVCLDHMGKPRTLLGEDVEANTNTVPNEHELAVWREGMKAMAALPNVYVKISMLGYSVPGWIRSQGRTAVMRNLVRETVQLFGPSRCMVATNWWKSAALSDADGLSDIGPDPVQLINAISSFLDEYSEDDRNKIFYTTACDFYSI